MESHPFDTDLLTDHEPGRIPGGGTPPSTAGETPAATKARFIGRLDRDESVDATFSTI
jgi:hypothetical protein